MTRKNARGGDDRYREEAGRLLRAKRREAEGPVIRWLRQHQIAVGVVPVVAVLLGGVAFVEYRNLVHARHDAERWRDSAEADSKAADLRRRAAEERERHTEEQLGILERRLWATQADRDRAVERANALVEAWVRSEHGRELKRCQRGRASGEATLDFVLTEDLRVRDVRARQSSGAAVASCLEKLVARWKFPEGAAPGKYALSAAPDAEAKTLRLFLKVPAITRPPPLAEEMPSGGDPSGSSKGDCLDEVGCLLSDDPPECCEKYGRKDLPAEQPEP